MHKPKHSDRVAREAAADAEALSEAKRRFEQPDPLLRQALLANRRQFVRELRERSRDPFVVAACRLLESIGEEPPDIDRISVRALAEQASAMAHPRSGRVFVNKSGEAYQRAVQRNDLRLLSAVLAHERVHCDGYSEVEAWSKAADVLEKLHAPSWVVDYHRGRAEQAIIDEDR